MTVFRQVVLPVARLLVWAVIAASLFWLAFGRSLTGGGTTEGTGPLTPTGEVVESVVPAALGDVASTLELSGTVAAEPAVTVKATAAGTVGEVHVGVGQAVGPGTPLLDVVVPLEPLPQPVVTAPDGTVTSPPAKERVKVVTVRAGSAGTVASLAVLEDQEVSVGTDVATVSPGTLTVTAPLTQAQQFRLLTPPASASAQAPGGPAPFSCTDLRTGAAAAGDPATPPQVDPSTGAPAPATTAQVTCRVPAGTTVFAGMSVDLTLDLGTATGVVVVPVTAVLGTVGEGRVWVAGEPGPDGAPGEPVERTVRLGLTDGTVVQVVEGLAEGEQVLEYTPVPADEEGGPGLDGGSFGYAG